MKFFRIKKNAIRRSVFIIDTRGSLKKPKVPLCVLWKIHKPEVFVDFVFSN